MGLVIRYWGEYPSHVQQMIAAKIEHQLNLLDLAPGASLCDVGGGWGAFACYAGSRGLNVTLIDDFADPGFSASDPRYSMPQAFGVNVLRRDVIRDGLPFADNSIDAFTSFDVLEHLHASPKPLLHQMMRCLKPGGTLLIGVPNCVNLRKRITVPLGYGKWSALEEWYERPAFRSHVREPDVSDLRYIAKDLRLENVCIKGANFSGMDTGNAVLRAIARLADPLLRLRPSLCADLFLIGKKGY
jgi:SAM-dependent methyltransferase